MFSGKSEELIRRVKRAVIARRNVQVFKPIIDDRFGVQVVRSHDGDSFVAHPVHSSEEIPALLSTDTTVVGIDEVQFFDHAIVGVVRKLVASGPCTYSIAPTSRDLGAGAATGTVAVTAHRGSRIACRSWPPRFVIRRASAASGVERLKITTSTISRGARDR